LNFSGEEGRKKRKGKRERAATRGEMLVNGTFQRMKGKREKKERKKGEKAAHCLSVRPEPEEKKKKKKGKKKGREVCCADD